VHNFLTISFVEDNYLSGSWPPTVYPENVGKSDSIMESGGDDHFKNTENKRKSM